MMRTETLSTRRERQILAVTFGFALWQASMLDVLSFTGSVSSGVVTALGLVGAVTWIAAMGWMFGLFGRLREGFSEAEAAVLDDELVRANRAKSMSVGFWVMVTSSALLLVLTEWLGVSGRDVSRMMLIAGVCSATVTFVTLERADA